MIDPQTEQLLSDLRSYPDVPSRWPSAAGDSAADAVIPIRFRLADDVLSALAAFSDHLPVLADYGYRIPGDATGADKVDFNDFLVLQNNFNKTGTTYDQGNFDYSATTDFNDFLILQNNFGTSIAGVTAPAITSR